MGKILIKYKIMPENIKTDLEKILEEVKNKIIKNKATFIKSDIQNIAFGLKCLVITVSIDENEEITPLEEDIKKIKTISSLEVIDFRRAIE